LSTKTVVVKIGGSTLGQNDTSLADLVTLQQRGLRIVVVHGGGSEVSSWLKRLNLGTRFVEGLRVTGRDELPVVTGVLAGLVNKQLVCDLLALGGLAVGLSGVDGSTIKAKVQKPELGYVGQVTNVNGRALVALIESGFIPVVSPICWGSRDDEATLLNVNADDVAAEIASALGADSLVYLTDVPGIMGATGVVYSRLTVSEVEQLVRDGTVRGGMIPKARACILASRSTRETRIIDGTVEHALLSEFERNPGGTTIVRDELA
jgi:acetylglutamate kinase